MAFCNGRVLVFYPAGIPGISHCNRTIVSVVYSLKIQQSGVLGNCGIDRMLTDLRRKSNPNIKSPNGFLTFDGSGLAHPRNR